MCYVYCKTSVLLSVFSKISRRTCFCDYYCNLYNISWGSLNRFSTKYNKVNKYLYLFIFCVFLSYLVAIDPKESWDYGVYHFLKALILYFMVMSIHRKQKGFEYIYL